MADPKIPSDSDTLLTYKELIYSILTLTNEDDSEYDRYETIGINMLREFHLTHMNIIKIAELNMDDNHRVALPTDCIWVKCIGFPKHGRLWTLTRDDRIYLGKSWINGFLKSDSDTLELIEEHPKHGYNARGRNSYNFTIDYNTREVIITGSDKVKMTLHYLSSGVNLDGDTFIPSECLNALQSAIIHRAEIFDKRDKVTAVRANLLRSQMKSDIHILRVLMTKNTLDEWHDMFLHNQSQGVIR